MYVYVFVFEVISNVVECCAIDTKDLFSKDSLFEFFFSFHKYKSEVMNLSLLWLKINFTNTFRDAESFFSPLSLSQHTLLSFPDLVRCVGKRHLLTFFFSNTTHRLGTMLSPERRSSSSSSHLGEDTVNA